MIMVNVEGVKIGGGRLALIAGPCVIESEELVFTTAEKIKEVCADLKIPFIFKSSYKKANRTSLSSFTGIGDREGLEILSRVKKELGLPVLTDIHNEQEAEIAAKYVDILQIPAFLCRQTELLIAAAKTGKTINVKKGQFLSPYEMQNAVEKIASTGNGKILMTERGSSFGYNNLVVDMRSLVIMKEFGYPVVMDATHSVQMPGAGKVTGGQPKFILPLAKAAAAVGIDALFLEVHPEPQKALSDAASQLPLNELKNLLSQIIKIDDLVKEISSN